MEKQKLPNSTAVLVLGIFSILTCCLYGIIGIILGVTALVLAKKDIALYRENPDGYEGYGNVSTGRILAIIGLILSGICLLINVYFIAVVGQEGLEQMQKEMIEKMQQK